VRAFLLNLIGTGTLLTKFLIITKKVIDSFIKNKFFIKLNGLL